MKPDPKTFEIKRLAEPDLPAFKSLVDLFNAVFEEDASNIGDEADLAKLLGNPRFIVLVALAEHEVAGGLTAYELPLYYAERSEVFLYDMAIKPDYQRMGIGRELIRRLKDQCLEKGTKQFFVLAHEEDEHAIEFYHATGGKSERVLNFLYETSD